MIGQQYNLRAGYYHEYTGIGRCTDENLTTNKVVDLLNEQNKEINRLNNLVKIATDIIAWNTVPQCRRQWEYLKKEMKR